MGVGDWQKRYLAKPAEPAGGQDERRIRAAARLCRQAIKGATARSAAAPHYYQKGGISMNEDEACKVHILYAAPGKYDNDISGSNAG